MALRRADVAMLMDAMAGFKRNQAQAFANRKKQDRYEIERQMREAAAKRERMESDRRYKQVERQIIDRAIRSAKDDRRQDQRLDLAKRRFLDQQMDRAFSRMQGMAGLGERSAGGGGEPEGFTEPMMEITKEGTDGTRVKTEVPYSRMGDYGFTLPDAGGPGGAQAFDPDSLVKAKLQEEMAKLAQKRAEKQGDIGSFNMRDVFSADFLPFGGVVDSDKEKMEGYNERLEEIRAQVSEMEAKKIRERYQQGRITKEQAKQQLQALGVK